jgi:hypothetical protein
VLFAGLSDAFEVLIGASAKKGRLAFSSSVGKGELLVFALLKGALIEYRPQPNAVGVLLNFFELLGVEIKSTEGTILVRRIISNCRVAFTRGSIVSPSLLKEFIVTPRESTSQRFADRQIFRVD